MAGLALHLVATDIAIFICARALLGAGGGSSSLPHSPPAPTWPMGLIAGTFVFAVGVAFIMPALLTLAVSRVPPTERGSVSGTVTVFLDIAFGFAPVALGLIANRYGYPPTFIFSAALAAAGAALLIARRRSLEATSAPALG